MAAKMCEICNKRRVGTGPSGGWEDPAFSASNGMCNVCGDEGQMDIAHNNGHESIAEEDCWYCNPKLQPAEPKAKGKASGPKAQGTRRPQLRHAGHSHGPTPKGRRECKAAFWAEMAKQGVTPETVKAEHFAAWDQKKMPQAAAPKGGWAGVAPLGPKGGAGASVKAAGAKAKELTAQGKLAKAAGLVK